MSPSRFKTLFACFFIYIFSSQFRTTRYKFSLQEFMFHCKKPPAKKASKTLGKDVPNQAAKLPTTSGLLKKIYFEKICPRQRSCPGQVACSKKNSFFEKNVLPQATKLPGTSGLFKKIGFFEKQFCPRQRSCPRQVARSQESEQPLQRSAFWGSGDFY